MFTWIWVLIFYNGLVITLNLSSGRKCTCICIFFCQYSGIQWTYALHFDRNWSFWIRGSFRRSWHNNPGAVIRIISAWPCRLQIHTQTTKCVVQFVRMESGRDAPTQDAIRTGADSRTLKFLLKIHCNVINNNVKKLYIYIISRHFT